jgi:uncharacterized repeat protein (TIGR02543 family)
MKRHSVFSILLALLACLLALGLSLVACKNGTTDDHEPLPSVVYENTARDSLLYRLTITQKAAARAASDTFTPAQGDSYKLEIIKEEEVKNTSTGTVQGITNDTFTLKPLNSDTTFSVKVSGEKITNVTGSIAVQGSDTPVTPGVFATSSSGGGGGGGGSGGGGGGSSSGNSQGSNSQGNQDGNSQGSNSQSGNSQGGSSQGGNSKGGSSQGGNSQGGNQGNIKTYTVTFNANGGTGTVPDPMSGTVNEDGNSQGNETAKITLPSGDGLSKSGYAFDGWNTKTDGSGTNYQPGDTFNFKANTTLYAKWVVAAKYTITFDANGGTGAVPDPLTVNAGSSITFPSGSGLTRTGYTFSGWNTNSAGTGTNYSASPSSFTVTSNMTFYARWISDHTHEFQWVVTTPAGISTDGLETETCSCGAKGNTRPLYATGTPGLEYELINNGKAYNVRKGMVVDSEPVVYIPAWHRPNPDVYEYFPVTTTADWAFSQSYYNSIIILGSNLMSIGDHSFHWSDNITSFTIPSSVTSIGDSAFEGCTKLTSVTIPESVTTIGDQAFAGSGLTSVTIPSSVKTLGEWAFVMCQSLTSATISAGSIGKNAFVGTNLTSLTITESVTHIGESAFNGLARLTSVTIPSSVTSIDAHAFQWITSLTSVTISARSIGKDAFYMCTSLTSVTITSSVTSIGEHAFAICESLASVTCLAASPPTLGDSVVFFATSSDLVIKVPADSVDAYKQAANWSSYADQISAM